MSFAMRKGVFERMQTAVRLKSYYFTALGPIIALTQCSFVVNSTRRFMLSLALRFVLVFFSPFSIAITSLEGERAELCVFRAFVCFARVGFVSFLFLLVSEIGCDLWFRHSLDFSFYLIEHCKNNDVQQCQGRKKWLPGLLRSYLFNLEDALLMRGSNVPQHQKMYFLTRAPCKRFRSGCAFAESDQNFHNARLIKAY